MITLDQIIDDINDYFLVNKQFTNDQTSDDIGCVYTVTVKPWIDVRVKGQCERIRIGLSPDDMKALDRAIAEKLIIQSPDFLFMKYSLTELGQSLVK